MELGDGVLHAITIRIARVRAGDNRGYPRPVAKRRHRIDGEQHVVVTIGLGAHKDVFGKYGSLTAGVQVHGVLCIAGQALAADAGVFGYEPEFGAATGFAQAVVGGDADVDGVAGGEGLDRLITCSVTYILVI